MTKNVKMMKEDEKLEDTYFAKMMSSKGVIEQFILVHGPKEIPVEECHVIC